jgi:hypothetical protein
VRTATQNAFDKVVDELGFSASPRERQLHPKPVTSYRPPERQERSAAAPAFLAGLTKRWSTVSSSRFRALQFVGGSDQLNAGSLRSWLAPGLVRITQRMRAILAGTSRQ